MSDIGQLSSAAENAAVLDCVTWTDWRDSADPCVVLVVTGHGIPPQVQDVLVAHGLSVDMEASGTRTGPETTEVIAR
ncbi:hypothetical protein HSTV1_37 [Haloarcula sinaiiensis tailed virus 1]|uniref:Uncharacterized protein n=1 Tax=Haloarcula sinaiiensis tailed virus 1 TaxID=1262530 RepID=R9QSP7_9CAUD|nr:hypothetical protein HSTV1_37 [Haloarcula sinaiiensis tailed virus 1]AGC34582.1 hypothetical protein HSTV1_37 [Haloarcula sinaiiensis tailed virus 1]